MLATASVDWRAVLYNGDMASQVELKDGQVTLGLIDLCVSLYGKNGRGLLRRDDVEYQVRREASERSEKDRVLFGYCRQWWSDYLFINPELHNTRMVKMFAGSEGGRKELVCRFVETLRSGLISPGHAARFVSLIPLYRSRELGNETKDVWMDLHT